MPTLVVTDATHALMLAALKLLAPLPARAELVELVINDQRYTGKQIHEAVAYLEQAKTSPVRPFLDLSTAHLDPSTRDRWTCTLAEDFPGTVLEGETGWMVSVPTDNALWGPEWGAELPAVFDAARACGAHYILFDADACPIDSLPTFEDADEVEASDV